MSQKVLDSTEYSNTIAWDMETFLKKMLTIYSKYDGSVEHFKDIE